MTTPLARYTGYQPIRGTSEGADVIPKLDDAFESTLRGYMKATPQNRKKTIRQRLTDEDTWDKYRCLVGEEEMQPLSYLYGNGFAADSSSFSGLAAGSDKVTELGGGADSIRWTTRMAITQALNYVSDSDLATCIDDLSTISLICDGNPGCLIDDQCIYDPDSTDNSLCRIPRSWADGACQALKVHLICTEFYNAAAKIDVYVEHTERSIKKVQIWSEGYEFAGSQWGTWETVPEPGVTGNGFIAGSGLDADGMPNGDLVPDGQGPDFVEFTIKNERLPWMETPNEGDKIKIGTFWLTDSSGISDVADTGIRIEGLSCDVDGNNTSTFAFATTNRMNTIHENATGTPMKKVKLIGNWGCFGMIYFVAPIWGQFYITNITWTPLVDFNTWDTRQGNWEMWDRLAEEGAFERDQVTFDMFEDALLEIDMGEPIAEELANAFGERWLGPMAEGDVVEGTVLEEVLNKVEEGAGAFQDTVSENAKIDSGSSIPASGGESTGDGGLTTESIWTRPQMDDTAMPADGGAFANAAAMDLAKEGVGVGTNMGNGNNNFMMFP